MRIVVVGAGGFMGPAIVEKLKHNHEVIPLYKGDLDILNTSAVKTFLETTNADVIINCITFGGKDLLDSDDGSIVGDNLNMLYNFYSNQHLYNRYINIGSGVEYEKEPKGAYAVSKKLMSRVIMSNDKFFNLRVFGCFAKNEHPRRLLKRYVSSTGEFKIKDDRLFDYISLDDFCNILEFVISDKCIQHTIDCVYEQKITISEFLTLFCDINNIEKRFVVESTSDNRYIGNYGNLSLLVKDGDIKLYGIAYGLKVYNE